MSQHIKNHKGFDRVLQYERHDGCSVEKGACRVDSGVQVLYQSSIEPDPREESLVDPVVCE
jgi:hypothetical protein